MRNDRRKDRRRKIPERGENEFSLKNTLYIAGTILALGIIAFFVTVMVYNNSLDKIYSDLEETDLGKLEEDMTYEEDLDEASATLGKTVNEIEQEIKETSIENEDAKEVSLEQEDSKETETKKEQKEDVTTTEKVEETKKEETKELSFISPVEGEISKEYAKDKLVYSETLKEWVTHMAIDIEAEKTTIVKSAEEGTVTAIKNDPRYGTTVIIEHENGYETRYANLLTAEFVAVGEKVSKGQTIGTVGDTGAFEVLDKPHLHFELLKDGEYQDPTLLIK